MLRVLYNCCISAIVYWLRPPTLSPRFSAMLTCVTGSSEYKFTVVGDSGLTLTSKKSLQPGATASIPAEARMKQILLSFI